MGRRENLLRARNLLSRIIDRRRVNHVSSHAHSLRRFERAQGQNLKPKKINKEQKKNTFRSHIFWCCLALMKSSAFLRLHWARHLRTINEKTGILKGPELKPDVFATRSVFLVSKFLQLLLLDSCCDMFIVSLLSSWWPLSTLKQSRDKHRTVCGIHPTLIFSYLIYKTRAEKRKNVLVDHASLLVADRVCT